MCYSHAKNSIYMHCKGACSLCFRRLYNILCLRKVFYQVFLPLMIMISYFAVKDFIYFLSSIINFHRINWKFFFSLSCTVRKVSKYRVISDPYFPVFGVNVGKIQTRNNSIFRHFSHSDGATFLRVISNRNAIKSISGKPLIWQTFWKIWWLSMSPNSFENPSLVVHSTRGILQ